MNVNEVQTYMTENGLIASHQHIVLGLSGGPDSVCLFHVLRKMADEWDLSLHPVHINHQIRPEGAMHDQKYVEKICAEAGLACRVVTFDCEKMAKEQGLTTEEAGRIMRYRAFDEEAQRICASGVPAGQIRIATAHNADDQVETVLLRLLRGTGTAGLAGIDVRRKSEAGFWIVRPILFAWKEDILRYCEEHQLDPCVDSTNAQPLYARNRVRLSLIPVLQEYNAGIKDALLRLSEVAGEEKAYLDGVAESALGDAAVKEGTYRVFDLLGQPDAVRHRAVGIALKEAGLTEDVSWAHYRQIDRILRSESPSAEVSLPHGFRAVREYENLRVLAQSEEKEAWELRVTEGSYEELQGSGARFDKTALEESYGSGAAGRIRLRTRREGDYIAIPGGRKKLQDLFVDSKVPKHLRDGIRLVAIGSEVLWIPPRQEGLERERFSARYRAGEAEKNVILVEVFTVV